MKKIILPVLMALISMTGNAQEVFNEIYSSAYKTAIDVKEDQNIRKMESFKVDALDYLRTKSLANATGDSISAASYQRLDSLAYYLYDYVNLFANQMSRQTSDRGKDKVIKLFHDCSLLFPLYRDPDLDLVLSYCRHEGYTTQFSLDTDWIKANAEVRRQLKDF